MKKILIILLLFGLVGCSGGDSGETKSKGGSTQVKGHYRKDGTYVKPHTRKKKR